MSNAIRFYRSTASFDEAAKAFQDAWIEDGKILSIRTTDEDPKDFRTVQRGLEILEAYVKFYPDDPENTIRPEVSFEVPVGVVRDRNIMLRGRIDGVVSDGKGGARIGEDKTTSRLGDTFFDALRGSLQIGLYLYAADQYGLFDIGKRTTPSCLMNAIKVHPKEFKFTRDVAIKSRNTLHFFKENALRWVDRMIASEEENIYPLNDIDNSTCTKYGGCDYLPLKYAEGELRKALLLHNFQRKEKIGEKYVSSPLEEKDIINL
jgi:hypothetical protein